MQSLHQAISRAELPFLIPSIRNSQIIRYAVNIYNGVYNSLLKMLYLAMIDITKKWTGHRQDWGEIHSQLEVFFEERLEGNRY